MITVRLHSLPATLRNKMTRIPVVAQFEIQRVGWRVTPLTRMCLSSEFLDGASLAACGFEENRRSARGIIGVRWRGDAALGRPCVGSIVSAVQSCQTRELFFDKPSRNGHASPSPTRIETRHPQAPNSPVWYQG